MKKILVIVISLITLIFITGCVSSKKNETVEKDEVAVKVPSSTAKFTNHSFLTEENIGQTFTITGLLQKSGEDYLITENIQSKSSVVFSVIAEDDLIKRLDELENSMVTVTGLLIKVESPWRKTIQITLIN